MVLTLEYLDEEGKSLSFWIRSHEVVKVGSSVHADHPIENDPDLDKIHFLIRFEENEWILESASVRPLQLNGVYTRLSVLKANDRIQAGKTKFTVVLPIAGNMNSSPVGTKASPSQIQATDQFLAWWRGLDRNETELHAHMVEHRIRGAMEKFSELIPYFRSFGPATLAWNRNHFGQPTAMLSGWDLQAIDLFSQAPQEIRNEHSLSVGAIDWNAVQPNELASILVSDSAVLLFHTHSTTELLEKKKIAWAWFARPSMLQFHLRNGSDLLVSKLLDGVDMVATTSAADESLLFYGQRDRLRKTSLLGVLNDSLS